MTNLSFMPNGEITPNGEELRACYARITELEASLQEMITVYWGDGDGYDPPPACIQRAQAVVQS